jgi:hypothetical protein
MMFAELFCECASTPTQGHNLGIMAAGGVSLFWPTKRAWPKSCPMDISGTN